MLGTVRKVIQDDGKRRLSYYRRNNGLLLSLRDNGALPLANDPIVMVLRAYSSSVGPPITSTSRKDESSSSSSSSESSLLLAARLPMSSLTKRGYSFHALNQHSDSSLMLPPIRMSSYHGSHRNRSNGRWESKIRYNPQYESRVFFSSTPSSENESKRSQRLKKAKIPIPKSAPNTSTNPLAAIDLSKIAKGTYDMTVWITKSTVRFVVHLPGNLVFFATHPKERREKIAGLKESIRKEVDHYWVGIKLLMADVKTARNLLKKTLQGSTLTRRERKQLLRTVSDLFRLVPMSMFLIIPAMEFALPFALKVFPNMLPSTFQDSLKNEENMKRELKSRIAMAEFFQETMEELAHEQKRIAANRKDGDEEPADSIASKQEKSAVDMLKFLDLARQGEMIPPDAIIEYANYFQDDLTLDNMPRMQLINLCRYMSVVPYGSDSFLRFQLRHNIRMLKEDDQRILWEGIDSLTKMELREACQDRGMRSTGLSREAYKRSLQQWLDLSVNKNVPISLLIMSRTFFLQEEIISPSKAAASDEAQSVTGLADAISGMDKEVLNEVILQVATSEEFKSDPDVRKIQLEVVTHQNEKIKEEQAERDAKKTKKKQEASEKEDVETIAPEPETTEAVSSSSDDAGKITKEEILDAIDVKVEELQDDLKEQAAEIDAGERDLSPEEMESISQLLSADPVVKEKEQLSKIKKAMEKEEEVEEEEEEEEVPEAESTLASDEASAVESTDSDKAAASIIEKMESEAAKEADESTTFTTESELDSTSGETERDEADVAEETEPGDDPEEDAEDPVVARLKKRIESMVDKIETQISDIEVKIGDKMHYLDKDMDGILSREEMADVLVQVLKKDLSFEEALEIADEMDENKDGVFTVQELIQWIETNQLVKFESEGRDAEMDKIMESHSNEKEEAKKEKE